ncbi:MAG: diphthine--ammonia ligase, partial [Candidatus Altiarchaeota archaeon]|nr:diphthine--ammonia ligase [Candidatus Altiarchaeota archaeon]
TEGVKEEELKDLKRLISRVKDDVDGVLTGAIASNYQRERIDRICRGFDLESISPLWHINPERYWRDLLNADFKIMVTAVSAEGLDEHWLGRIIDEKRVDELKELHKRFRIHLAFEGGEAETLVLYCPMFKKEIKVVEAEKRWSGQRGTYIIKSTKI